MAAAVATGIWVGAQLKGAGAGKPGALLAAVSSDMYVKYIPGCQTVPPMDGSQIFGANGAVNGMCGPSGNNDDGGGAGGPNGVDRNCGKVGKPGPCGICGICSIGAKGEPPVKAIPADGTPPEGAEAGGIEEFPIDGHAYWGITIGRTPFAAEAVVGGPGLGFCKPSEAAKLVGQMLPGLTGVSGAASLCDFGASGCRSDGCRRAFPPAQLDSGSETSFDDSLGNCTDNVRAA